MKLTRKDEAQGYEAAGHSGVAAANLQAPDSVAGGHVALNRSVFQPGGRLERTAPPPEMIYYVLAGELTLLTDEGEFVLHGGDSVHFAPGEARALENRGTTPVEQLIIARVP